MALTGSLLALAALSPQVRLLQAWVMTPVLRRLNLAAPLAVETVPYGVAIAAGGGAVLCSRYLAGG